MSDLPIDPSATPQDDDGPDIAADDAGASALTEQPQDDDLEGEDGEGEEGEAI